MKNSESIVVAGIMIIAFAGMRATVEIAKRSAKLQHNREHLYYPNKFNNNNTTYRYNQNADKKYPSKTKTLFPTQKDIRDANAILPIMIDEYTMLTSTTYDEKTKVQTFNYRFIERIHDELITEEDIKVFEEEIISNFINDPDFEAKLNAGMTYLYVYYSIDNHKLYELRIDNSKFKLMKRKGELKK